MIFFFFFFLLPALLRFVDESRERFKVVTKEILIYGGYG